MLPSRWKPALALLLLARSAPLLAAPAAPPSPPATAPAATPAAAREVLPFLADDYPKARALARSRKLPLFIEAWAPW